MTMRLQRALSRAGIASRRKAEELIVAGRVTVNGNVAQLGMNVVPDNDDIRVDGRRIEMAIKPVWIVLNKPPGFITTRHDPSGRRSVFELVDDVPGLTYVGRLDYLTEGLLLLTNDGDGAHALTHPSSGVERTYVAVVRGDAAQAAKIARKGVQLDDGMVYPSHIAVRPSAHRRRSEFEITLKEGKNREVRRICEALGLSIETLTRISFGPVRLGSLPSGASRPLSKREELVIESIRNESLRRKPRSARPAARKAASRPGQQPNGKGRRKNTTRQ